MVELSNLCSFVADLDAPGIKALVTTASLSQAPTLKDLIYRYLRSRTSIGVDISVRNSRRVA